MFSRPVMIDGSPKVRSRGRPIKMMEDDDVITTSSDVFTRSLNGEGPNVIPGVELMLSLRTLGMNMCPEGLRDYMDRIEFFNPRQLVGCVNSLECAIMNIPCVVQTKAGWERIVDMKIPPHMRVKHLDVGDIHAIGYRTENGMVSLGGTRVERVIDYIVPKYDGLLVVCVGFKTATSVFTVVLSTNGCDIIHDSYFSLSGELMYQSDIMAFYGNMFQEYIPSKLKIGGIEYNVKPNVPMTINDFLDAKPEPYVDGYIISIDCVEYKIKERNTIDIFYNGRFLESSDHVRYNILSGKDKLIEYGVYECYGSVDGVHVMKYRRDKTVVQSAAEVKSIFCAADCTYMRQIVPKNCPMQNESSHDVVCIQEMIQKVTDELVAGEHPVAVVTAKNVKEILHRNLITYDLSELNVVTQNIRSDGVINDRQTSIDKTKIKTVKREFKYASCATIYKVMTDMMYEGHPRFIAKKIAYKLNVRVSPRKIFLMGCRGELFFSQFGLRVKMINKRVLPYVYNGYVPHEFVDNKTDVKMALMNYNKFNDTKFALDKDMEAFTRELIELRDICDDEAILEEVGDVFTVLVKLCMRLTGCRTEIYNGNNPIWKVLLSSPALVPYKIKMRKRLEEYGCIRHHKTSESHVCSNGIPFVPVKLDLEKYDDDGDNDRSDNIVSSEMKCD